MTFVQYQQWMAPLVDIMLFSGIQDGSTALHLAVVTNHSDLVTSLIADGAHVDAVDGKGR